MGSPNLRNPYDSLSIMDLMLIMAICAIGYSNAELIAVYRNVPVPIVKVAVPLWAFFVWVWSKFFEWHLISQGRMDWLAIAIRSLLTVLYAWFSMLIGMSLVLSILNPTWDSWGIVGVGVILYVVSFAGFKL